jgi:hypothetical protein
MVAGLNSAINNLSHKMDFERNAETLLKAKEERGSFSHTLPLTREKTQKSASTTNVLEDDGEFGA